MALSKGAKLCCEWLQTLKAGDIVGKEEILRATGWKDSSLKTYVTKNKLAPFLFPRETGDFKILMNGSEVSERYFHEVFTQIAPPRVTLSINDRLTSEHEEYVLIEPLGNGAVGHVWSARLASRPDRLVAVKIMLPRTDLLAESKIVNVRQRFRREAINGAKMKHPYIVDYIDHGELAGNPFLVMELANHSLGARLRRDGALAFEDAALALSCVSGGLRYLHQYGSPHRDVKPDNILVFPDTYKLGDLGIVKWSDFEPTFTTGGTITRSSVQLGSWFYMAPEQQQDPHDAVPASDIYALGVSWIELLTGALPSPQAVGAGAFPAPCDDDEVCALIRRMVAYDSRNRPQLDEIDATLQILT